MSTWASEAKPLASEQPLEFYRGVLSLESRVQRLRVATLVVLTGQLGLSIDEAIHCHDGWIDWTEGTIEIPVKDFSEPAVEVLYEDCWSPRARALLASTYDRWDVLESDAEAAQTFRHLGLSPAPTARIIGVDASTVTAATDGIEPTSALERLAGQRDPSESFPIGCGTDQLPSEPVDPATEPANDDPAPHTSDGVPLEPAIPDSVDYDASDHAAAGKPTRRPETTSATAGGERSNTTATTDGEQPISTDAFAGGRAVDGRIVLGSAELLVLREDGTAGYVLFSLSDLRDVSIDSVPSQCWPVTGATRCCRCSCPSHSVGTSHRYSIDSC